jgi:hypothetical protein
MEKRKLTASLALIFLAACGGTGVRTSGSEPAQEGAFVPGAFTNLPKPPGAVAYEPAANSDGVWTQSFHLLALGPAETMQFYAASLGTGWAQLSGPSRTGTCFPSGLGDGCTYRSVWIDNGQRLEISSGPDGPGSSDPETEFSLTLMPQQ